MSRENKLDTLNMKKTIQSLFLLIFLIEFTAHSQQIRDSFVIYDKNFLPQFDHSYPNNVIFVVNDDMNNAEFLRLINPETDISLDHAFKEEIWCKNAIHLWFGNVSYRGYKFKSDKDYQLTFEVTANEGYRLVAGRGEIIKPDKSIVILKHRDTTYSEFPHRIVFHAADDENTEQEFKEIADFIPIIAEKEEIEEMEIFTVVESMPEFPGGDATRMKFLQENIRYPQLARENGIQGTVFVTFVVEVDGSLTDVRVLRGIGGGCNEEALRLVETMPNWIPGNQRGNPVRVQFNMPVRFTLTK
jgi:TonB family protein